MPCGRVLSAVNLQNRNRQSRPPRSVSSLSTEKGVCIKMVVIRWFRWRLWGYTHKGTNRVRYSLTDRYALCFMLRSHKMKCGRPRRLASLFLFLSFFRMSATVFDMLDCRLPLLCSCCRCCHVTVTDRSVVVSVSLYVQREPLE